jgi:hypothetical protein
MKKLNDSQFRKVVKLLTYQFSGKTLAQGNRFGYNNKNTYAMGDMVKCSEGKDWGKTKRSDCGIKIGNGTFTNAISKLNIFTSLPYAYDEFYSYYKLDVARLKANYSNGLEAVIQAYKEI